MSIECKHFRVAFNKSEKTINLDRFGYKRTNRDGDKTEVRTFYVVRDKNY